MKKLTVHVPDGMCAATIARAMGVLGLEVRRDQVTGELVAGSAPRNPAATIRRAAGLGLGRKRAWPPRRSAPRASA